MEKYDKNLVLRCITLFIAVHTKQRKLVVKLD